MNEPVATALLFTGIAALIGISVVSSRASERLSVPVTLLLLAVGVMAGSEGLGGIAFEDYHLAFRLGTAALVLILFDGGLNTPTRTIRQVMGPAGVLSTVGVAGTTVLVALAARLLGVPWSLSFLLGAIVSSTDAAAVFAVLRGSNIQLKRRVGGTLEVESGANDPLAVILTTALTATLASQDAPDLSGILARTVGQLVVGGVAGWALGLGGRQLLRRFRLPAGGLYAVFSLSLAFFVFGAATLIQGSGFLAVYVAGVTFGNAEMPYRGSMRRVHDAIAWLAQIGMFLMLGLLVFPSRLIDVAATGTAIALFLAIVARPLITFVCLAPFRYPMREIVYIGWVGLRGAVPIVLATVPVLAQVSGADFLFNIVFFIVVVNAIIPGATVPWITRKLDVESDEPPAPKAVLEIEASQRLNGRLTSFYIDEDLGVAGEALVDLPFPDGSAVTMIVRGADLIPPRGATRLQVGDHVYVLASAEDEPFVQMILGRPETD
jgi:potassium/hydrogen antiporter